MTGATGYVGGQLVPALLDEGWTVRVLTRRRARMDGQPLGDRRRGGRGRRGLAPTTCAGRSRTSTSPSTCCTRWTARATSSQRDRELATTFAERRPTRPACRASSTSAACTRRASCPPHLASRVEVGEHLPRRPVPTAVLQAGVVLGDGSASFDMLRHLTERLPAMVAPQWLRQPDPADRRSTTSCTTSSAPADLPPGGQPHLRHRRPRGAHLRRDDAAVSADATGCGRRSIVTVPVLTPRLAGPLGRPRHADLRGHRPAAGRQPRPRGGMPRGGHPRRRSVRRLAAAPASTTPSVRPCGTDADDACSAASGRRIHLMTDFSASKRSTAVVPFAREAVWQVLTDARQVARLTPMVRSIEAHGDLWVWKLAPIEVLGRSIGLSFTERMDLHAAGADRLHPHSGERRAGRGRGHLRARRRGSGTRLTIDLGVSVDLPFPRLARPAVQTSMHGGHRRDGRRLRTQPRPAAQVAGLNRGAGPARVAQLEPTGGGPRRRSCQLPRRWCTGRPSRRTPDHRPSRRRSCSGPRTSRSRSGTSCARHEPARGRWPRRPAASRDRWASGRRRKSWLPQTMSWCRLSTSVWTVDGGAPVRRARAATPAAVGSIGTLTWTRWRPATRRVEPQQRGIREAVAAAEVVGAAARPGRRAHRAAP